MSRALTTVRETDSRHPMLKHLDAALADKRTPEDEGLDVSFMSRSFCLSGLPLRKQYERDKKTRKAVEPAKEVSVFSRKDERFALSIASVPFDTSDAGVVQFGLPYGARARMLILWMTTAARQKNRSSGDRWLEIGRIDDWLESCGITPHPNNASMAKDQLIRLAFTVFTMSLKDGDRNLSFFNRDVLINSAVFAADDLPHYLEGNLAKVRFPLGIELSQQAYNKFTGDDVIPVSTEALRGISSNAMAIDLYLYLAFRLPLISHGESELVTWQKLANQFGSGEPRSRFRQVFDPSVDKALAAYRGANVTVTDEGLVLRYSDPAEAIKMFAVGPRRLELVDNSHRVRNRVGAKS